MIKIIVKMKKKKTRYDRADTGGTPLSELAEIPFTVKAFVILLGSFTIVKLKCNHKCNIS